MKLYDVKRHVKYKEKESRRKNVFIIFVLRSWAGIYHSIDGDKRPGAYCSWVWFFNTLNAELNPIRHLLVLVGARHIVHVSRIRVNDAVAISGYIASNGRVRSEWWTERSVEPRGSFLISVQQLRKTTKNVGEDSSWPFRDSKQYLSYTSHNH